MNKLVVALLLTFSCLRLSAQSLDQIQQDIRSGNYSLAERELKQGIVEHPNSARGYYDLAYVEYKLNNIGEARAAVSKCRILDPTLSFAHDKREVFQLIDQLQDAQQLPIASPSNPYLSVQHSHSSISGLAFAGFIIAVFLVLGIFLVMGIAGFLFSSWRSWGNSYEPRTNMDMPIYNNINPPIVQQGNTTASFLEGLALGGIGGALLDETLRPRTEVQPQIVEEQRTVYLDPPTPDPNIQFDSGNNDSWSDGSGNGSSSDGGW